MNPDVRKIQFRFKNNILPHEKLWYSIRISYFILLNILNNSPVELLYLEPALWDGEVTRTGPQRSKR